MKSGIGDEWRTCGGFESVIRCQGPSLREANVVVEGRRPHPSPIISFVHLNYAPSLCSPSSCWRSGPCLHAESGGRCFSSFKDARASHITGLIRRSGRSITAFSLPHRYARSSTQILLQNGMTLRLTSLQTKARAKEKGNCFLRTIAFDRRRNFAKIYNTMTRAEREGDDGDGVGSA